MLNPSWMCLPCSTRLIACCCSHSATEVMTLPPQPLVQSSSSAIACSEAPLLFFFLLCSTADLRVLIVFPQGNHCVKKRFKLNRPLATARSDPRKRIRLSNGRRPISTFKMPGKPIKKEAGKPVKKEHSEVSPSPPYPPNKRARTTTKAKKASMPGPQEAVVFHPNPSQYRTLFDETINPQPLSASQLHCGDLTSAYELHACIQHTPPPPDGRGAAYIGPGCGIFITQVPHSPCPDFLTCLLFANSPSGSPPQHPPAPSPQSRQGPKHRGQERGPTCQVQSPRYLLRVFHSSRGHNRLQCCHSAACQRRRYLLAKGHLHW